jgi:O-antigen/teichoic acid export membrane protein
MDANLLGYLFMFAGLGWTALTVRYIGTDSTWKIVLIVGVFLVLVTAGAICLIYPTARDYMNSHDSTDK